MGVVCQPIRGGGLILQVGGKMTAEEPTRLRIGHVLFIDVVGYSKLLVNEQSALLRELTEVVTGTHEFREAESVDKLASVISPDPTSLLP